jgi:hypothetical protein
MKAEHKIILKRLPRAFAWLTAAALLIGFIYLIWDYRWVPIKETLDKNGRRGQIKKIETGRAKGSSRSDGSALIVCTFTERSSRRVQAREVCKAVLPAFREEEMRVRQRLLTGSSVVGGLDEGRAPPFHDRPDVGRRPLRFSRTALPADPIPRILRSSPSRVERAANSQLIRGFRLSFALFARLSRDLRHGPAHEPPSYPSCPL